MDHKKNWLLLFICTIWCILLISTSLFSAKDLVNGLIIGRLFWFHGVILFGSCICIILCFYRISRFSKFTWIDILLPIYVLSIIQTYNWALNPEPEKLWFAGQLIVLWYILRLFIFRFPILRLFLISLLIGSGILQAILGLKQLYGFDYSNHHLFNLTGTFLNPGPYSGYLAVLLPIALHATFSRHKIIKLYAWISVSLTLSILPAGMSRSAWLAAIIGCGYVLITHYYPHILAYWKEKQIWCIGIGIILITFAIGLMSFTYQLKKASADGRFLMWKVSSQIIIDQKGIGVGLGSFPSTYANKQADYLEHASKQEKWVAGCPEYAFNEYLQIGVEQGIFSLALFLIWFISIIYKGTKRGNYGCVGGIITLLVFAFSSYPFQLPDFWVLGITMAVLSTESSIVEKQEEKNIWMPYLSRFCMIICAGTGIFFFLQEKPFYKAYQSWRKIRGLYQNKTYKAVVNDYKNLYDRLCHKPEFLFEAAQCLSKTGENELAISYLSRASLLSSDPMILYVLAKNEQCLGNFSQAEKLLLKGIRILPERIYPYFLLVHLYSENAYNQPLKQIVAMDSVLTKKAKIENSAIKEMRRIVKEQIKGLNIDSIKSAKNNQTTKVNLN